MGDRWSERRTIPANFVEEALDCLRRRGLPTAGVLATIGLPPKVDGPISAEAYGALWTATAAALDDEFFGLGGRAMRPGSFTLLCHSVVHAGVLRRALPRALRFLSITLDDPRGERVVADGLAQVILRDAGDARSAFAYRTFWIILHGLICWLVGRRIPLRLVDFRCKEPGVSPDYRSFFGAPVRFDQPASRLAFDEAFLDLPIRRSERSLREFLRGAPANILVRHRSDPGVAASVRTHLRAIAPTDWPGFDAVARTTAMPVSTLRHRLRREGWTFASIKDELRRDIALERLINSQAPVSEIALELGFAEPSAFHRAFRKWTSKSPGAFRREAAAAGGSGGAAHAGRFAADN